jgi:uncharacterized repeat protein (TIGR03803 family)
MRQFSVVYLSALALTAVLIGGPIGSRGSGLEHNSQPWPRHTLSPSARGDGIREGDTSLTNGVAREQVLYNFKGRNDASSPKGDLISDASGALYGTAAGGSTLSGTVYKLTPSGSGFIESVLYTFASGNDGSDPTGLIADTSGALYGTTFSGGTFGRGIVYKLVPSGSGYTESVLYDFGAYSGDGAAPSPSALITDGTGAFYGTTYSGGSLSYGTVFKLTPSGSGYTEAILYGFQGGTDGAYPWGGLLAKDGVLYGSTLGTGGSVSGSVYKLTPSRTGYRFEVLYDFLGAPDGDQAVGDLSADRGGALYGTTAFGGADPACLYGCGTVFKLTPSRRGYSERILHSFQYHYQTAPGVSDGSFPVAGVIVDGKGVLYGTATRGGRAGLCYQGNLDVTCGTVFKLTPRTSGYAETSFPLDGVHGYGPFSRLLRAKGGWYGTTYGGGQYNAGTVFKMTNL